MEIFKKLNCFFKSHKLQQIVEVEFINKKSNIIGEGVYINICTHCRSLIITDKKYPKLRIVK